MISEAVNMDNMLYMKQFPDKFFDIALVDPPYGIGIDGQKKSINKNPKHNRKHHEKKGWDNEIPSENYFTELSRVSKYQIIFGGNYFTEFLPPVKGWIVWYKGQNDLTMSDCELIWTNLPMVSKQVNINRAELVKQNTFHPTEKPYKLYRHILSKYCDGYGKRILDTHLGSGSSRIAAYDLDFDFFGCELDADYFEKQEKRFAKHQAQTQLFVPERPVVTQTTLL